MGYEYEFVTNESLCSGDDYSRSSGARAVIKPFAVKKIYHIMERCAVSVVDTVSDSFRMQRLHTVGQCA